MFSVLFLTLPVAIQVLVFIHRFSNAWHSRVRSWNVLILATSVWEVKGVLTSTMTPRALAAGRESCVSDKIRVIFLSWRPLNLAVKRSVLWPFLAPVIYINTLNNYLTRLFYYFMLDIVVKTLFFNTYSCVNFCFSKNWPTCSFRPRLQGFAMVVFRSILELQDGGITRTEIENLLFFS